MHEYGKLPILEVDSRAGKRGARETIEKMVGAIDSNPFQKVKADRNG